jgi:hypothetical protein
LAEKHGIVRAPATLNKLRVIGGGPRFRRIGSKFITYDDASLDSWATSLISAPLSSTSQAA